MNLSKKTIALILTISICLNIFALGFIVANSLTTPTSEYFADKQYAKRFSKADFGFHKRFDNADFAKYKKIDVQNEIEQIAQLRKQIATLLTEPQVDVAQVEQLLGEVKNNEDIIRSKFEKKFLDKVLKMNQTERQKFVKKIEKKMQFRHHKKFTEQHQYN
jgi:uncharacterized membrane protein